MRSFALTVLLLAAPGIASAHPDEHGKRVRRGAIDNYAVVYDPRRNAIIDVAPLW